ncbi:MAG: protein-disulfide reductase DsbD [Gammaproteobacteria bacterium]|jgi:thiol:disulfide interchange protein DsbD
MLLLSLAWSPLAPAQDDELLPPEEAFALSAHVDGDSLIAEYRIAPGYYMYRKRFEFALESSDRPANLGDPVFPKGKIKHDEFFGEMEIYRDSVRVVLPLLYDSAPASQLKIRAVSQGCADIGVCYPPLKQALDVDPGATGKILPTAWVPPEEAAAADADVAELQALLGEVAMGSDPAPRAQQSEDKSGSADTLAQLQALGAQLGLEQDDEILPPEEAFALTARLDESNVLQTRIDMPDQIYLYRDKVKIEMAGGSGHALGQISIPRGKQKNDEFLGLTEVIYHQLKIAIPVVSEPGASDKYSISYQMQGCVEDRICYPPLTRYLNVDTGTGSIKVSGEPGAGALSQAQQPAAGNASQAQPPAAPVSEQDRFAQLLLDESLLLIVALFFLAGIGLTFTPCVFPMIPILSSIIAGQGSSITTGKAFSLSLVYVLSMAFTYAAAGAIVGYYGAEFNIQIWFQNPWILSIFAAIFVLLALSMFGFYELQMPNAIQSRLTNISNSQQGGTLIGVGLMGFFSAIIVGPCITAPLVGALIFISQTQDWQLGGLALFALGLGMGLPLLLIGTSAGKLLPRAGGWMDKVKAVFGVVLLGVAVWLLERILPVGITMGLIAALMIGSAIYLGAMDSLGEAASGWRRFSKAMGILILIYGVAYLIGAAAGSKDLVQPLRGVVSSAGGGAESSAQHLAFRQIKGRDGLQLALDDSVRQRRNSMLDFYADWCISCKEMEKYAFSHPGVIAALADVNTLQADVTGNDRIDTDLMSSLGIYGPPAILFFDPEGREIRSRRVVGEMSGEEFAAHVIATFQ